MGVFNLSGRIVPVVNIRRRFSLQERPLEPTDKFIICRVNKHDGDHRQLALVVDDVGGVLELPDGDVTSSSSLLPGLAFLEGVARTDSGLVLIHDLGTFLALDEEKRLDESLAGRAE